LANLDFEIFSGISLSQKGPEKNIWDMGIVMSDYYYDDFSKNIKVGGEVNWIKKRNMA
jgi:hypothetical protein